MQLVAVHGQKGVPVPGQDSVPVRPGSPPAAQADTHSGSLAADVGEHGDADATRSLALDPGAGVHDRVDGLGPAVEARRALGERPLLDVPPQEGHLGEHGDARGGMRWRPCPSPRADVVCVRRASASVSPTPVAPDGPSAPAPRDEKRPAREPLRAGGPCTG